MVEGEGEGVCARESTSAKRMPRAVQARPSIAPACPGSLLAHRARAHALGGAGPLVGGAQSMGSGFLFCVCWARVFLCFARRAAARLIACERQRPSGPHSPFFFLTIYLSIQPLPTPQTMATILRAPAVLRPAKVRVGCAAAHGAGGGGSCFVHTLSLLAVDGRGQQNGGGARQKKMLRPPRALALSAPARAPLTACPSR